jgi:hypothetical protein
MHILLHVRNGETPQPEYRCVHVVYQGESFKAGTYTVHNLQDEPPRSVSLHFLISTNFLSGSKGWLVRSQMKAEKKAGKDFQPRAMKYVGRSGAKIGLFQNIMQSVSYIPLPFHHLRLYLNYIKKPLFLKKKTYLYLKYPGIPTQIHETTLSTLTAVP